MNGYQNIYSNSMFQNPYSMNNGYIQNYQQQSMNRQEIVRVNGRNGAETYQIAPNSSVLLLDEQEPIVWLKSSDGAGYATITPYKIIPQKTESNDFKSLEDRIKRLEDLYDAKSNNSRSKQNEPNKSNDESNKYDKAK